MKKVLLLVFILFTISIQAKSQHSVSEVYAVFLYTFIKHVDNPVKTGDYKISIIGDAKLFKEMQKFHGAKTPTGQTISIVDGDDPEKLKDSRIVFLSSGKSSRINDVKEVNDAVLIVTERNGMINSGSCINFKNINNKIYFEISEPACREQRLKVSSTLFSLAK